MKIQELTLTQPDDWHLHLRDGDYLATTLQDSSRNFKRAIIMPNLKEPVINLEHLLAYKKRILATIPHHINFTPLMTLYLTEETTPAIIDAAFKSGELTAVKLYPAHATTNSAYGVKDVFTILPTLETMAKNNIPLLIHGEVTDPKVDIFAREAVFINEILAPIRQKLPELKIVLEHVSTAVGVDYINANRNIAGTITPHHLLLTRNDLLVGGLKPHLYCLPIVKLESDRLALIKAATSGNAKFFLGTDSAPHPITKKESSCCPAGIYNAPCALELYAEVFAHEGKLANLEAFASLNGPKFYNLPPNNNKITLINEPWTLPNILPFGNEEIIPFKAGETLKWQVQKSQ